MTAEMPSRRAAMLSAASLLVVPLAAQAKPEDYAGGYTTKMFDEDAYKPSKPKCFSSGAAAPDACENPGGNPKDSRIYFGPDAVDTSKKAAPKEEPKS